jgi:hypothetical protein
MGGCINGNTAAVGTTLLRKFDVTVDDDDDDDDDVMKRWRKLTQQGLFSHMRPPRQSQLRNFVNYFFYSIATGSNSKQQLLDQRIIFFLVTRLKWTIFCEV